MFFSFLKLVALTLRKPLQLCLVTIVFRVDLAACILITARITLPYISDRDNLKLYDSDSCCCSNGGGLESIRHLTAVEYCALLPAR